MQGQATSQFQSLAGFQSSATHQTLNYLLQLSLSPSSSKTELIAAAELDAEILLALLSTQQPLANGLADWHKQISRDGLGALITAMSTQASAVAVSIETHESRQLWRSQLTRSLLSHGVARLVGLEDPVSARLIGLIAGHNATAQAPVAGYGKSQQQQLAAHLREWGCSHRLTDAILFFRLPPDELVDADLLIQVVALADRLSADTASGLPSQALAGVTLSEDALTRLQAQVVDQVEQWLSWLSGPDGTQGPGIEPRRDSLQRLVADAGIANALYKNLIRTASPETFDQQVLEQARFLFGASRTLQFIPEDGRLVVPSEQLAVTQDHHVSQLARCYRDEVLLALDESQQTGLTDTQLVDRLNAEAVVLLPLGPAAGVLACGVTQEFAHSMEAARRLLAAFAQAVADASAKLGQSDAAQAGLPVEYVQQRVREVTHEVNNPLAIVQNYLRTLSLKLDEDSPVQGDIETISSELMRVAGIVKKYASIGTPADIVAEPVDINQLIAQLARVFQGGQSTIDFQLQLDDGMRPVTVIADNLKQVIVNLIKNANEALLGSDQQNPALTLSTCAAVNVSGVDYVEIAVSDNGPGMDPDIRGRLFLPDNSSKGEGHSGIGLNIVKQLVDDMQGLISCRSQTREPAGTSFQILIPAAGEPAAGDPAAGDPAAGDPAAGGPAAGDPAAGGPAAGAPVGAPHDLDEGLQ